MPTKTKDVRIIAKGVHANLPEDRIAYLVNSVMGHRATSVEVEEVGPGKPKLTGEDKAKARVVQVNEKIRKGGKGNAEPA